MLKVLLVDSDPDFRDVLRRLLIDTTEIVGEAADAKEGVVKAMELRPDLILMSLEISGLQENSVARRIKAALPKTKVIVLTSHGEAAYLASTGKTGADAILRKRDVRTTLYSEMRRVAGPNWQGWKGFERRGQGLLTGARRWDGTERRVRVKTQRPDQTWRGVERRGRANGTTPASWDGTERRARYKVPPSD